MSRNHEPDSVEVRASGWRTARAYALRRQRAQRAHARSARRTQEGTPRDANWARGLESVPIGPGWLGSIRSRPVIEQTLHTFALCPLNILRAEHP